MTYPVHRDEVIDECRRRIERAYPPTVQTVVIGDGGDPASKMLHEMERLRACQDYLLSMMTIPHTYRSDHYWHGYPPGFRFQTVVNGAQQAQQPAQQPVYYPQPQHAPAPSSIVNNITVAAPGGGPVAQPGQLAPYPIPHMQPGQTAPHQQHQFVPPSMPSYPHSAGGDDAAAQVSAPAAAQGFERASAPVSAPAPPLSSSQAPAEVWDKKKEALFLTCKAALEGDADAKAKIAPFAASLGISTQSFCERVVSERARTIEVFRQMEAATP